MIKKISLLVMAITVLGAIVAGCSKPAEDPAATPPAKDAKTTTAGN